MAFDNILSEREDGIATVTINRPDARNALSSATIEELNAAFSEIARDESVRVAILRGAGDVAFCAGADLKEVAALSDIPARRRYFGGVANLLETIHRMPQPVIAQVARIRARGRDGPRGRMRFRDCSRQR
jgi:enoyl-CoA hydratase/carnithine racemase